jgi:tripartite-type tricarboxylate transporter receptor subunit TctC
MNLRITMLAKCLVPSAVFALALAWSGSMAVAQSYPSRAITAIIPFAGGSASDVVSRIVFDKMSKSMGQTIVVETLYKSLGYDPEKDLEMISPFAGFTIVIVVSKSLPVHSLKELIDYANAHPGLNFGSVGIGSSQHLAGEYFGQVTGVKITHVPYRNIAQYGPDLIAGTVPLGFQWFPNVAGPLGAKGAVALAVAGDQRIDALPDTPTTTEAGLPEYKVNGWFALLAPGGTPKPILEKLNQFVTDAVNDPAVRSGFDRVGAQTMALPLDEARKFQHAEIAKYREIITKAGIEHIE